ncbi:MAG: GHKL domain-containing protein [Lachnospiraceae bacterium]|nr:GHKL domain-containing protein [Lachnospiraceae bacterium]
MRASQQEQANYIAQLEKENERMGRIIHKDNRIVNAMADSVAEYLKDTTLSDAKRHEKGVALSEQIEAIRTDRQNILLSKERIQPNPIAQTGYVGVDALIAYIAKEAAQYHIALQFDFREDFFEGDTPCMPEEDLVHLLSDTLKNAIIATKHNNGKIIKLSMLKLKGIPSVAIADSGIPFTVNTYMNFGLEKSSTHTDEGGSGIGLLDIWSLKEKYKASLYIDEALNSDIFTKQIVFIFDKKNRYMISSNRYKEIQRQQSRADLYVVNPATEGSL